MSGDVQPRKRKDKKKKKDELGVEEPRGTAAALGDGDVFIHSQHDHGTGGHWCAKIIFFSLLAVLVTLIGLIILENRGLTELEANSVESRYSGVLEGWLEDAPDDDHHDAHTLELNHPDEEEHDEEDEEDTEVEIERIEKEIDLEPISTELPALPEENDDDNDKEEEESTEEEAHETEDDGVAPEDLDDDFLEDDTDEPPIERITAPVGKPLIEVEEEDSSEKPPDTLADEEEYEKQQEEKKREEEKASTHMWLKLFVGGALLVATHAVVRRATAPRDTPAEEERSDREETPVVDRRMTLIPEELVSVPRIPVSQDINIQKAPVITQQTLPQEEDYGEDDEDTQIEDEEIEVVPSALDTEDKELYSDEEVEEKDIEVKKEVPKLSAPKPEEKVDEPEPEPEDDDPDDVEIIDDEQLEEEVEEDEDEEEISDVDDAELLSRLEAKYGRLPEPERPGQKPSKKEPVVFECPLLAIAA